MPRPDVLKKGVDLSHPRPPVGRFPLFLIGSLVLHGLLLLLFTEIWHPPVLLTLTRAQIGIVQVDDRTLTAMVAKGASSGGGGGGMSGARSSGGHSMSRGPRMAGLGGDFFRRSPIGDLDENPARQAGDMGGSRGLREGLGGGLGDDGTTSGYRSDSGATGTGFGRERAGTRGDISGDRSGTAPKAPSAIQWNEGSTVRQVSSQPELEWPESLRGQAIRADVVVSVTVDPQGRVLSPVIQKSSGSGDLDRAVLDAVRRTLFQSTGGDAPSYGTIRYTFKY